MRAPANLKDHFQRIARRRVTRGRIVSLNGRINEAQLSIIGRQVSLLYHEQEPECVEVTLAGRSYGLLSILDIQVNCRVKRDKNNNLELEQASGCQSYDGGSLWGKANNR